MTWPMQVRLRIQDDFALGLCVLAEGLGAGSLTVILAAPLMLVAVVAYRTLIRPFWRFSDKDKDKSHGKR